MKKKGADYAVAEESLKRAAKKIRKVQRKHEKTWKKQKVEQRKKQNPLRKPAGNATQPFDLLSRLVLVRNKSQARPRRAAPWLSKAKRNRKTLACRRIYSFPAAARLSNRPYMCRPARSTVRVRRQLSVFAMQARSNSSARLTNAALVL